MVRKRKRKRRDDDDDDEIGPNGKVKVSVRNKREYSLRRSNV